METWMNEAVFLHGTRDARVASYNLREGRPHETRLEVAAVGICGSDLHYYKDGASARPKSALRSSRDMSSAARSATTSPNSV
jgi:threonine dehydrogenase-like Zn-dependent dehydrogenase